MSENRKTSAEIIQEARLALQSEKQEFSGGTVTKPVQTKRPFTPQVKERLLFGNDKTKNRPPSAVSLKYLQPDNTETGNEDTGSVFNIDYLQPHKVRLPALDLAIPMRAPIEDANSRKSVILEPKRLLFENHRIVEHSDTLFLQTGYLARDKNDDGTTITTNPSRRTTETILNDCKSSINRELIDELYDSLNEIEKISSKLKIQILKTLYQYVESPDDELLLRIARVIFRLKVSGNNLNGVCKLMFKVAKNERNDTLFLHRNLLELFVDTLMRTNPLEDTEACVYGYGAIKFLTTNNNLIQILSEYGILSVMLRHMHLIANNKNDGNVPITDQINHVLFQLTDALRNLVGNEIVQEKLEQVTGIDELCRIFTLFIDEMEIVRNLSRIFSAITTTDSSCTNLTQSGDFYTTTFQCFIRYEQNEEIIVRLAYTLGTLAAKSDAARLKIFYVNDSQTILLNLWRFYAQIISGSDDVLIKIIRIVANILINPKIGNEIGNDLVLETLQLLPKTNDDELIMSILSTLNNFSYYCSTTNTDTNLTSEIIGAITEYTKSRNREFVTESMRILGNLSRLNTVREQILQTEFLQNATNLLDKVDIILLKTTVGVFVNLMADQKIRHKFKKLNGPGKLIGILRHYAHLDWLLGMLVCQVIWNYCIDDQDLYEALREDEIQQLLEILADHLDEEKIFGISSAEDYLNEDIYNTPDYLVWDEFATVATDLLEKFENFLERKLVVHQGTQSLD